jgi:hypothetical protein
MLTLANLVIGASGQPDVCESVGESVQKQEESCSLIHRKRDEAE